MNRHIHPIAGGQPRNGVRPADRQGESTRRNVPRRLGLLEWFRPGEHERVECVLDDLAVLGVKDLRTGVSWADWHSAEGREWYAWLIPRLARDITLLPTFLYTPPSLGIAPRTNSPPRDTRSYADFLDEMITRLGEHFEWVELWNEPTNFSEWDMALDPDWLLFCEMIGAAAYWARQRGKKTVLGGISPIDPNWVRMMHDRGVMQYIDAVSVHGFPGTFDHSWEGWPANTSKMRDVLSELGLPSELWITEVGFSTWRHDERQQVREFVEAIDADAERVYWYSVQDLDPSQPTLDGFHLDERDYHFGLRRADGTPKLLFRLWANGLDAVREAAWIGEQPRAPRNGERPVLITGGAGFVGTNLAHRLLKAGHPVIVYDKLARPGVERNVRWLREMHGDRVQVEVADVRDEYALSRAVERASQVFHFAAQVAVTTSLTGPVYDFEVNLRGTLNVLEAIRSCDSPPPLVFTSTNKVYGALEDVGLMPDSTRYEPDDASLRAVGIGEDRRLDFHSPYGCSKGAADQYVLDYARVFGVRAVVFRMSCIYGPHQFGTEDQGWVAHFLIRAMQDAPITIYGDGMQVRDVLYVDDLADAFLLAHRNIDAISGQAFNIGGGPGNTISLLELLSMVKELRGKKTTVRFGEWRSGDQRYYVSDISRFRTATGWQPRVGVRDGIERLYRWLEEARDDIDARDVRWKGADNSERGSVSAEAGS